MNLNDPFGIKKLQTMVARTQKAIDSVSAVSTNLSKNSESGTAKPALDSLAQTLKSASDNLSKVGDGIKKADTHANDAISKAKNLKL